MLGDLWVQIRKVARAIWDLINPFDQSNDP
jgi:hypothetical protein